MKAEKGALGISSQLAGQVDFGGGREVDIEYSGAESLWVATGPGIEAADMWFRSVASELDLRIRIIRTQSGIEVLVDRGQQDVPWWPAQEAPRLIVAIDSRQQSLSVSASVGGGPNLRQTLLGNVPLGSR
jgi:hypothetical protein